MTDVRAGQGVEVEYKVAGAGLTEVQVSLQRQRGTGSEWSQESKLGVGAEARTQYKPEHVGAEQYRVVVVDPSGAELGASSTKTLYVYGKRSWSEMLGGREAKSKTVSGRAFKYVSAPNIQSYQYDSSKFNDFSRMTTSTCIAVHLDLVSSDEYGNRPDSFRISRESADAKTREVPPGSFRSIDSELHRGESWSIALKGNYYLYINGYAYCYNEAMMEDAG